jgi:hypothetical protein
LRDRSGALAVDRRPCGLQREHVRRRPITRYTLFLVTSRTTRFALGGSLVLATASLFYVFSLPFTERVYRRRGGPWIHEGPRAHAFGDSLQLSPIEAVAWFVILGALAGGVLGAALARVHRRDWTFVLGGGGLMGTAGFVVGVALDEFTIWSGDVGSGPYNSFFGWAIAPVAAWALWTAIGIAIGAAVGRLALRVPWRT